MSERQKHWVQIFSKRLFDNSLGWYERHSTQTLNYLDRLDLAIPFTIFVSGAGTSMHSIRNETEIDRHGEKHEAAYRHLFMEV